MKDKIEGYLKQNLTKTASDLSASFCSDHPLRQILIDIPIGLKEFEPGERKCDVETRKYLGPQRGSSAFRVPTRKTVYCDEGYKKASNINFNLTGKKISKQTFNICKKIREIDELLKTTEAGHFLHSIMHESHPEAVFKSLAGASLPYSKKTKDGFNERLNIIKTFNSSIDFFLDRIYKNFRKYEVQPDDILDASALAIATMNIYLTEKIRRFPETPEFDKRGICMEIVFGWSNFLKI
ncbi:MAG: DUF429 domain-containing protein [Candidatus Humimicrobiaceae bacterium]